MLEYFEYLGKFKLKILKKYSRMHTTESLEMKLIKLVLNDKIQNKILKKVFQVR